jgi:hypothetical protein
MAVTAWSKFLLEENAVRSCGRGIGCQCADESQPPKMMQRSS